MLGVLYAAPLSCASYLLVPLHAHWCLAPQHIVGSRGDCIRITASRYLARDITRAL